VRLRWPWLIRSPGVRLEVTSGRVSCPLKGDIDVDHCVGCPLLVGAEQANGSMRLYCRPPAGLGPGELPYPI
jgi:hypothetical protein